MQGANESSCLHDGTWSNQAPLCKGTGGKYTYTFEQSLNCSTEIKHNIQNGLPFCIDALVFA